MKTLLVSIALVLAATAAQADCYRDMDGTTKCWNGSESYRDSDSNYGRAQQYLCSYNENNEYVCHWE